MQQTGLTHTSVLKVEDAHTAANIGSGDMQVLATAIMMALMENPAMLAVDQELPTEQTTVGSYINCTHLIEYCYSLRSCWQLINHAQ